LGKGGREKGDEGAKTSVRKSHEVNTMGGKNLKKKEK